jgi:YD repeat-containing protein
MARRFFRGRFVSDGRGRLWVWRFPRGRVFAALTLVLVSALLLGLLRGVPASAAPPPSPGGGARAKSVPVRSLTPKARTKSATDGRGITSVPRKRPPAAGSATVPVSGVAAKVGGLPVTLSAVAPLSVEGELRSLRRPDATPGSVRVRVLDQPAAKAVGVSGALLALSRVDGVKASGRVRLRVDYRGFADAFGGDFAGRLRLVQLPACALSTPGEATCRVRTDLGAVNAGGALSAEVPVAGAATVLAATASYWSAGGTFAATSLSQAYSWAAGNPGGSFTFSYPLPVPPAGVGPQPNLALTYDSGLVDGRTVAQNGQASWVGEGWDLQVGYIERSYRPCGQAGSAANLAGDLCWFSRNNATILFGGRSSMLVRDKTTNAWHSANDDGLKIEKFFDASVDNGDNDGEYWRITTQDGTQYFFGRGKRYSNDNERTHSVQTVPVYGDDPGEPCYQNFCIEEAYRWNLDYVVDPRGNTMTYVYAPFEGTYQSNSRPGPFRYQLAANLDHIDYGDVAGTEHAQNAPMRVEFETADRCVGSCLVDEDFPDTPLDLYCPPEAGGCANNTPVFFNNKRLAAVTAKVWDPVDPPKYRTVDRWVLTHTYPDTGDVVAPAGPDTAPSLWLQSVQHTGYAPDGGTHTEPATTFGGEPLQNKVDWGADIGVPPYVHYRLSTIGSGTGAETVVTYERKPDDAVECNRSWQPIPDNNPQLCFPQYFKPYDAEQAGFGWFYKYVVRVVRQRDLTGGSPDEWTFYTYANDGSSDSALWYHDVNESVLLTYRSWSLWRGYSTVTATKESADGAKTVSRNLYHRGMDGDGKSGDTMAWYSRRVGLLAPVGTPGVDGAISGQGGRCLDVTTSGTANGTLVQLYLCNGTGAQQWDWNSADQTFKSQVSGKCLDLAGQGTTNGTQAVIWDCGSGWSQKWLPQPNGSLKNKLSGRCLDLDAWGTANGTKVQLSDCNGSWDQVWQPQPNRALMNPQANRCMDVQNAATVDGTPLQSVVCKPDPLPAGQVQPMANHPAQTWQMQPNGSLKNPMSGRCADVMTSGTTNGTLVQLYTCNNTVAQVWQPQADGSLKNPHSGRCLDAGTNATGQLFIFDCNGSLTQKWTNRFVDINGLGGFLRDGMNLDGTRVDSSMIHVPTVTQTAMRDKPAAEGQDLYAYQIREAMTKTRTWIAADSRWRWTEARASYDSLGLPTDAADLGDTATAGDDTCIRTEYARNTGSFLVAYPSQVTEYAGACGSATILSRSQTFYDHTTTLGAAPTMGLTTKTQLLTAPDEWAVTQASYDTRGRPITNLDARSFLTTTTYTPSANLPLKEVKVSNPLGHTTTTTFDEGRGQPTQVIDANGKLTTIEYDPIGRRTAVWLPTEKKVNGDPASLTYAYQISSTAPHKLTTSVLQTGGTSPVYLTSLNRPGSCRDFLSWEGSTDAEAVPDRVASAGGAPGGGAA